MTTLNQGANVGEACRKIGVTEQTYYRWRKEYGGMRVEQAKRLKDLEKENARLKKLVAFVGACHSVVNLLCVCSIHPSLVEECTPGVHLWA